jgi:hypothetical protein
MVARVSHVGIESTGGLYRRPVYAVPQRYFELIVGNARIFSVSGRVMLRALILGTSPEEMASLPNGGCTARGASLGARPKDRGPPSLSADAVVVAA